MLIRNFNTCYFHLNESFFLIPLIRNLHKIGHDHLQQEQAQELRRAIYAEVSRLRPCKRHVPALGPHVAPAPDHQDPPAPRPLEPKTPGHSQGVKHWLLSARLLMSIK